MCGIVAVVRRPSDRTPPSLSELAEELRRATGHLDGAPASARAGRGRSGSRRRTSRRSTRRCAGVPGVAGAHRRPGRGRRARPGARARSRSCWPASRPASTRRRRRRPRRPRGGQRRAGPGQGRGLGGRPRPAARRARGRRARRRSPRRRPRSKPSRPCRSRSRRSTGSRCAAATPPASTSSSATTGWTSTTDDARGACCASGRPTRCSAPARCATPDGAAELRLQGGGRDRRAGRQRRRAPRARSPSDDLLHRALDNDVGARPRARPHALGERRDHLGGQRPPAEPGGGCAVDGASRRVRTSPPRSTATSTTSRDLVTLHELAHPAGDHHRRQGHPGARRPPASTPASRSPRRSGPRSPRSKARSRSARTPPPSPDQLLLALRGSGQALYVGLAEDCFVVASEPYGLVEETPRVPAPRRRDAGRTPTTRARAAARSSCSTPTQRRDARRHPAPRPTTARALPVDETELASRADHDARHRPRRLPALPAQGDLRGAGVVPQDAAGQDHRARRRAGRRARPRDARPTSCGPGSAPASSSGCW